MTGFPRDINVKTEKMEVVSSLRLLFLAGKTIHVSLVHVHVAGT